MNYTINLRNIQHIPILLDFPAEDILLQTEGLSRVGGIDKGKLQEGIHILKKSGKQPVLSWDCLVNDSELSQGISYIKPFVKDLKAIRFVDPGIGMALIKEFPNLDLEISLEHGSLNETAVTTWISRFLPQLKKLVFSVQMPLEVISKIRKMIPISTEILAAGPIGIFYSRRTLITDEHSKTPSHNLFIASDDRPDQNNPITSSSKGSIVFYDKPLNIFHVHDKLKKAGIDYARFEYIYEEELKNLFKEFRELGWLGMLKQYKKNESIDAFIMKNPTHELFSKLKNKFLSEKTEKKAGLVIEAVKPKYCLINLDIPLTLPQKIKFISPERKTITTTLESLRDLKGKQHQNQIQPGAYMTAWYKYVVTGSLIQLTN